MTDPYLIDDPVFRLIRGRQRWAFAHHDDLSAYVEWIRGHLVICVCDEPLTRTTWLGPRARLDPLEEPEGTWTHRAEDGSTWDDPGDHVARPLLTADVFPSPPCAMHSPAESRPAGGAYQLPEGAPGDGQPRYRFGPALTGPFDTWPPLRSRIWTRLTRLLRRHD